MNTKAKVGVLVSLLGSSLAANAAAAEPRRVVLEPKVDPIVKTTPKFSLDFIASQFSKLKSVLIGSMDN